MMEAQLIDIISTVGFPIAISIYLMWERGTLIKDLTKTIQRNTEIIKLIKEKLS